MKNIASDNYKVNNQLSQDIKELFKILLQTNPKLRPKITAIINSSWVTRILIKNELINKPRIVLREKGTSLKENSLDTKHILKKQSTNACINTQNENFQTHQIHDFLEEDSEVEERLIESIKSSYLSSEGESEEGGPVFDYPFIESQTNGNENENVRKQKHLKLVL